MIEWKEIPREVRMAVLASGRPLVQAEAAVKAYQRLAGLTVDGIVGRATWDSLYSRVSVLRQSGPVITVTRMD